MMIRENSLRAIPHSHERTLQDISLHFGLSFQNYWTDDNQILFELATLATAYNTLAKPIQNWVYDSLKYNSLSGHERTQNDTIFLEINVNVNILQSSGCIITKYTLI